MSNIGAELDFASKWSIALSARYSAWDYGSSVRKFRTFEVRPEIRHWFTGVTSGVFAEVHLAAIYYNVALDNWKHRIQDRGGKHPALGGGIGIGYRRNFRNSRWGIEASLGLGVYHLEYDRFENFRNGRLTDSRNKTFFGVDRLGVSLVYNFNAAAR